MTDSIACALYMIKFTASVSLHLGVAQPNFRAHAWVQCGNLIVNDTKYAVEEYSEIMRIDL
ncbi:lasso peptide biosynthesis B2 protein [Burkholderia sp. AU31624]|uniref:lasso peptide biosynthesis B2 protein n=1 Tax=Burkholderia sp. AU31624 TaxID=2879629 RepID=UPI001CF1AED7|nr:lasso peptide biosynthesis B2 protein [Burkholderia sp. AU31624]